MSALHIVPVMKGNNMDGAMIDIGSNSVRLLYRMQEKTVRFARITRLADNMQNGVLCAASARRTLSAAARFAAWARKNRLPYGAYATSAVRDAKNKEAFAKAAARLLKTELRVLSGEEEAAAAFAGAAANMQEALCVLDIGGRSTETAFGKSSLVNNSFSLPIGAVNTTQRGLMPDSMAEEAECAFKPYASMLPLDTPVLAVAGTVTTLAALEKRLHVYEPALVDGFLLTDTLVQAWITRLAALPEADRDSLPGMQKGRGKVIVAGCCILLGWMRAFHTAQVFVRTTDGLDAMLDAMLKNKIILDEKSQ